MRSVVAVAALFFVSSCKPAPSATADTKRPATTPPAPPGVAVMPGFPDASPGAMRLVSAGGEDLTSVSPAKAGLCEQPAVLLVQSNQPGLGALLVLALPAASSRVGRYPVSYSVNGPAKLPDPPAAQFAVQRQTDRTVLGFQALEGNVEVYGFGAKVSGRFQVTLRELSSEQIVRVAGTFSEIPVEAQPRAYCERFSMTPPPGGAGR